MILYNVTVKIMIAFREDWEKWMRDIHIPDVMNTECFIAYKISRILGEDENEGVTFAIQYLCPSMEKFREYQEKHAKRLQADHSKKYHNKYVAFRTLMEVIQQETRTGFTYDAKE